MIKIGTCSYLELKEILSANNKQAVDRKLERYGVSFNSSGRGDRRVYEITEIENPFKLYCITELGISAQANFDKIRNLYYYFFCVDGFTELPLVEMENTMQTEGANISRQCISNARAKGKAIGRPQIGKEDIPAAFLRHYPAYKNGQLNVSELARVCDLSRTTVYKYIGLLEE